MVDSIYESINKICQMNDRIKFSDLPLNVKFEILNIERQQKPHDSILITFRNIEAGYEENSCYFPSRCASFSDEQFEQIYRDSQNCMTRPTFMLEKTCGQTVSFVIQRRSSR